MSGKCDGKRAIHSKWVGRVRSTALFQTLIGTEDEVEPWPDNRNLRWRERHFDPGIVCVRTGYFRGH